MGTSLWKSSGDERPRGHSVAKFDTIVLYMYHSFRTPFNFNGNSDGNLMDSTLIETPYITVLSGELYDV